MDASPSKRRVLGALDVNTTTSPARTLTPSKRDALKPHSLVAAPSTRVTSSAHATPKRPLEVEQPQHQKGATAREPVEDQRPSKKLCLTPTTTVMEDDRSREIDDDDDDDDDNDVSSSVEQTSQEQDPGEQERRERQRSDSPADSSIFDNSAHDISQSTVITEPDAEVAAPAAAAAAAAALAPLPPPPPAAPPQRPAMTREEARHKAEILRLRLGLASYKVRTGQTEVPLERLQQVRRSSLVSGNRSFPGPFTSVNTTNGYNHRNTTTTYGSRSFGGLTSNMNVDRDVAPRRASPPRQRRTQQHHPSRQLPPFLPPPSASASLSASRRLFPPTSSTSLHLPCPRPLPRPSPWRDDDIDNEDDDRDEDEEQQPKLPPPPTHRQTSAPPPQRKALPSLQPRGASFSHAPRDAAVLASAPAVAARDLLRLSRA